MIETYTMATGCGICDHRHRAAKVTWIGIGIWTVGDRCLTQEESGSCRKLEETTAFHDQEVLQKAGLGRKVEVLVQDSWDQSWHHAGPVGAGARVCGAVERWRRL